MHQYLKNCAIEDRAGVPFLPCFLIRALTCASVKPVEGCTSKADKTWSTGFAKALSIFFGGGAFKSLFMKTMEVFRLQVWQLVWKLTRGKWMVGDSARDRC